jgi:methanogenic corrinoid protein MtbC1
MHSPLGGAFAPAGARVAVPRLSVPYTYDVADDPALSAAAHPAFTAAEIDAFVALVVGDDDDRALAHVAAVVERGVAVEAIYLDLLTPTARRLGTLWEDDACDFVDVTVALGRLQSVLRSISHLFVGHGTRPDAGRVLLSCIPGEQHTLGLFMVSEFFVRDGGEVSLGSPIADCDVCALVQDEWFDVVGFSVACNSRISFLSREIPRLRKHSRNPRVAVMVGGRVFADQPELVGRVQADASATDARTAPQLARRLVAGGVSAIAGSRRAR